MRTNAVIVIEAGRVRSIDAAPPTGAQVMDLSQYSVSPGFIDAHTHALLQGDATADDYHVQLLKESLPYRALRATTALRIALDHGLERSATLATRGRASQTWT